MNMNPTTGSGLSDTPYDFREEEGDDILRVASYHQEQLRRTVIHFSAACHEPVLPSVATPFTRRYLPYRQFSSLERLPLELSHTVIPILDVQSLFNLRQTSVRLRDAVDSVPEYRPIVAYGLDLYCALLRTRHASRITLSDFHTALCTWKCAFCGNFGGFISFLIWERCCFWCIRKAPQASVQTLQSARQIYTLNKREAHQLTSLKLLSIERYASGCHLPHFRNSLVSTQQAQFAWGARPRRLEREEVIRRPYLHLSTMGACALPYYDSRTRDVELGLSCAGCELNAERKMEIAWANMDRTGFNEACDTMYRRIYTRAEFLKHFRWCAKAQRMWNSSRRGDECSFRQPDVALIIAEFPRRWL